MKLTITQQDALNIINACKHEIASLKNTRYEQNVVPHYEEIIKKVQKQMSD